MSRVNSTKNTPWHLNAYSQRRENASALTGGLVRTRPRYVLFYGREWSYCIAGMGVGGGIYSRGSDKDMKLAL